MASVPSLFQPDMQLSPSVILSKRFKKKSKEKRAKETDAMQPPPLPPPPQPENGCLDEAIVAFKSGNNKSISKDQMRLMVMALYEEGQKIKHEVSRLKRHNEVLASRTEHLYDENIRLKKQVGDHAVNVSKQLEGCALLPSAPTMEEVEKLAKDQTLRNLTAFELKSLCDGLRNLPVDDLRIVTVAKMSQTWVNHKKQFEFRVHEWSPRVQWLVYYCVMFNIVKKSSVQHSEAVYAEKRQKGVVFESFNVNDPPSDDDLDPQQVEQALSEDEAAQYTALVNGNGALKKQRVKDLGELKKKGGHRIAVSVYNGGASTFDDTASTADTGDDWGVTVTRPPCGMLHDWRQAVARPS